MRRATDIWLASGVRTPFSKVDGALAKLDAIELSVPVARHMVDQLKGGKPDFAVWGTVVPNLTWSNIAREVLMEAGIDATVPAFSTVMACSTSMMGVIEAAGMIDGDSINLAMVGGVDSLSRIQIGLDQRLSDWLRKFQQARSLGQKIDHLTHLHLRDLKLYIPAISNRTTGLSMGEHTEITAKEWQISRAEQDEIALSSHRNAVTAWDRGFFDDLVIPIGDVTRDTIPRKDTTLEKLARLPPSFDRTSGKGSLTAGNSSPLTDGAAGVWVASEKGLDRLPTNTPRVKLVDWEIGAVDFRVEGLLMAPAFAIPRLLARHDLTYGDIHLWEIHEAFAAQVAFHLKALQDATFLRDRAKVPRDFGPFPRERMNPNGGSTALGHPFGATGARIIGQTVKELAAMPRGQRAIVSICADGGQGSVLLLEAA
ncbi:MAG: acetyl-CoA C-acyltransferase [Reyranella sp.]|uniref:acetyl-CoA C-acyltransferase n=1 Tax=Reyranella sp. TaxID=1929291 RepID=UPI001200C3B0|nr:acetyl-CoA C-acyltransferase [Reyranella sp.]TAJ92895.1 MAG: acetyl-CoA C-acyltransferase [Reyranella sp.]TBR30371.1 MAG: acetyl-CoA C-acyltransferase [Reyranella sp.]